MPDNVPQLLSLLVLAKMLCVSPHTVRAWVRQGKLRPVRICRYCVFTRAKSNASCGKASEPGQSDHC